MLKRELEKEISTLENELAAQEIRYENLKTFISGQWHQDVMELDPCIQGIKVINSLREKFDLVTIDNDEQIFEIILPKGSPVCKRSDINITVEGVNSDDIEIS